MLAARTLDLSRSRIRTFPLGERSARSCAGESPSENISDDKNRVDGPVTNEHLQALHI